MPCRKENYLLLEPGPEGPQDVDALVARIGDALQLHGGGGGHAASVSVSVSCLHGLSGTGPGGKPAAGMNGGAGPGAPVQKRQTGCCVRLRARGHNLRTGPYGFPGTDGDRIRPWTRKKRSPEDDDPHRLLQDLILSGNLIKEAVRRLQFSAEDCGASGPC